MLPLLSVAAGAPQGVVPAKVAAALQRKFGNQFVQRLLERQQVTAGTQAVSLQREAAVEPAPSTHDAEAEVAEPTESTHSGDTEAAAEPSTSLFGAETEAAGEPGTSTESAGTEPATSASEAQAAEPATSASGDQPAEPVAAAGAGLPPLPGPVVEKVNKEVIKYKALIRVGGAATQATEEMAKSSEQRQQELANSNYGSEQERSDTWVSVRRSALVIAQPGGKQRITREGKTTDFREPEFRALMAALGISEIMAALRIPENLQPLTTGDVSQWIELQNQRADQDPGEQRIEAPKVEYITDANAREKLELRGSGELLQQKPAGSALEPYDTTEAYSVASGAGWAIYAMDAGGRIYAAPHRPSQFHHSSFLAGAAVAGAGEIKVEQGKLTKLTNKSGHYAPTEEQLENVLDELQDRSIDLAIPLKVFTADASPHNVPNARLWLDARRNKPQEAAGPAATPEQENFAPEPGKENFAPEPEKENFSPEPEKENFSPEPEKENFSPEPEKEELTRAASA